MQQDGSCLANNPVDVERYFASGVELPALRSNASNGNPYSNVFPYIEQQKYEKLRKYVKENKPVIYKQKSKKYCKNMDIPLRDITNVATQEKQPMAEAVFHPQNVEKLQIIWILIGVSMKQ